ncbi:hypothetical protein [Desulfovibrio inopinatus]|uniref:hypothetical protein n=1 Tax=Desulfovibrio inopinatus TaxID=102109 RepID=UPI0004164EFB|nr:hypothetical protein [Desulfovibrio inopinatus]
MADQSRLGKDPLQGLAGSRNTSQRRPGLHSEATHYEPFSMPLSGFESRENRIVQSVDDKQPSVEPSHTSSALLDGLFLPYFEMNEDGIIVFGNRAFNELVDLDETIGSSFARHCVLGRWREVEQHACTCALEQSEGRGDFMEIRGRKGLLQVTVLRRRMTSPEGDPRLCCTIIDTNALRMTDASVAESSRRDFLPRLGGLMTAMADEDNGDGLESSDRFTLFSELLLDSYDLLPSAGVDLRSFLDRLADKITAVAPHISVTVEIELDTTSFYAIRFVPEEDWDTRNDVEAIVAFEKAYSIALACVLALRMAGIDPLIPEDAVKSAQYEEDTKELSICVRCPDEKACVRIFDNASDGGIFSKEKVSLKSEAGLRLQRFVRARGGAVFLKKIKATELQITF